MRSRSVSDSFNPRTSRRLVKLLFAAALAATVGCAPLPPVEEPVPDREPVAQEPSVSKAERDSIIAVRRSFGYERWKNGDYQAAIMHYQVVRQNDLERQFNIYRALADSYLKLQMADSALFAYEEGVQYFPNDDYLRSSLAIMYRNLGREGDAIEQMKEAVRVKPEDESYLQMLKELYIRTEDWENAMAVLKRLVELKPTDSAVANELTNMIRTHRDPEEYLKVLSEAVQNFPDDAGRRLRYAQALAEQGQNDRAVQEYEKYCRMQANDPNGWRGLAKLYDNLAKYDQAISAHKKVVDLEPDNLREMTIIGEDYLLKKDWLSARLWARRALEKDSDFGPAWLLLGDIYNKAADATAGETPKYNDKLVFTIAHGLYQRAARSADPQARSDGQRAAQILVNNELVPTKEDRFMHGKETRPVGKGYEWINADWPEIQYIDEFLKNL